MFPIKKLLLKKFKNWGEDNRIDDNLIKSKAEEIIKKSTDNIEVLFYKNKTLYIGCPNSTTANELYLKQEQIKDDINKFLNQKLVKKLVIKSR